jgi:hypothetical protein
MIEPSATWKVARSGRGRARWNGSEPDLIYDATNLT